MITFNKTLKNELDLFTQMLLNNQNFALSRFGDGEMLLIKNKRFACQQWQLDQESDNDFIQALTNSFRFEHHALFKGIPCGCIEPTHGLRRFIFENFHLDHARLTFASIFTNINYQKTQSTLIPLLKERPVVLIANKASQLQHLKNQGFTLQKFFPIPRNAWQNHNTIVDQLLEYANAIQPHNTLFLFSAGPLSNVAIHRLLENYPDNTFIDMGSCFDPFLGLNQLDRCYQQKFAWKKLADCYWHHPESPQQVSCLSKDKSRLFRYYLRLKCALTI